MKTRERAPAASGMSETEPAKAASKLPRWKEVLFSSFLLLILAAALELSASLYLKATAGYDGEHLLQYEFDPYKNLLPTRDYVDTRGIRHNAQGFRHPEDVPRAKAPGTVRVFLMGGSTAYGTGGLWPHIQKTFAVLHDSTTIPAYLQQRLAAGFPGREVEVINAAIPSTWTHHHLIYLNQTILRYDPDLVLFLDGFNDYFFFDTEHDQFAGYSYKEHSGVIMGQPTVKALGYANAWWLSRKSAFFHVVFRQVQNAGKLLAGRPDRQPMDPQRSLEGLKQVFPDNALAMIERTAVTLQHEGVPAVFVLQPLLILEGERRGGPPIERELYEFNVSSYLPGYPEFMELAVPYVREEVRSSVAALGGAFIDATAIYDGVEGQIFTDYAHLTPLGNRLLAALLADTIAPILEARESVRLDGEGGD